MLDTVIVDTDILIDAGRNAHEAVTCLKQIENRSVLAASVVTQMELLVGCGNKSEIRLLPRLPSLLVCH